MWFAGFWVGITGTYPGSGSGSQTITIESCHSHWHNLICARVRTAHTDVFQTMQQHFAEDWCDKFAWEKNNRRQHCSMGSSYGQLGGRRPLIFGMPERKGCVEAEIIAKRLGTQVRKTQLT